MTAVRCEVDTSKTSLLSEKFDGLVVPVLVAAKKANLKDLLPRELPADLSKHILAFAARVDFTAKEGATLAFDEGANRRIVVACLPQDATPFKLLGLARKVIEPLLQFKSKHVAVELRTLGELATAWVDALASAASAAQYTFAKYTKEKAAAPTALTLHFLAPAKQGEMITTVAHAAMLVTEGTNLVRKLAMMSGNDLTCKRYHQFLKETAEAEKLAFAFTTQAKLKTMKAGAFLAVAQGSAHEDAGIAKLTYAPAKAQKHLVLVGKGIMFDTGGTNIKSARSMYGMNGDMAGSAVALATLLLAKKQKWPFKVTAYLAVADNMISNHAYRPSDVVTALSGKTIEIIHTDAEGRMVLADTLFMASQEKPDLIVDFATLTGACMHAIGTTYSGAFTNRREFVAKILAAGERSGERTWPFPLDEDFGECLESKIADIKQCRLSGGVDHIEAAYFLKEFIAGDVPWVHVDLSAIENEGGLAHVPTKETGFGVRLARELAFSLLS